MLTSESSIQQTLRDWSQEFDAHIGDVITEANVPKPLLDAVRYSMLAPGKRIRPFIVDRCLKMLEHAGEDLRYLGVAIECLHVFTLVHDDLPAMDDADTRRGLPANHKVHGEAIAILAGDALLAYAFNLVSTDTKDARVALRLIFELSNAIGWRGVIGGQVMDIVGENSHTDPKLTEYIHLHKTARLFECCAAVAAIATNANNQTFNNLTVFGRNLGLAFQITDDLLDVRGSEQTLGKSTGDADRNKQTYPQAFGIKESQAQARLCVHNAVQVLQSYDHAAATELQQLAQFVLNRTH